MKCGTVGLPGESPVIQSPSFHRYAIPWVAAHLDVSHLEAVHHDATDFIKIVPTLIPLIALLIWRLALIHTRPCPHAAVLLIARSITSLDHQPAQPSFSGVCLFSPFIHLRPSSHLIGAAVLCLSPLEHDAGCRSEQKRRGPHTEDGRSTLFPFSGASMDLGCTESIWTAAGCTRRAVCPICEVWAFASISSAIFSDHVFATTDAPCRNCHGTKLKLAFCLLHMSRNINIHSLLGLALGTHTGDICSCPLRFCIIAACPRYSHVHISFHSRIHFNRLLVLLP